MKKHISNQRKMPSALFALALAASACAQAQDRGNFFNTMKSRSLHPQQVQVSSKYKMGYEPSPAADIMESYSLQRKRGGISIPDKLDLRTTGLLPPIAMQTKNDCVAWSSAYYAYSFTYAQYRKLPDTDRQSDKWLFSPQYLYPHINKGKDQGAHISDAMNWLVDHGCASLAESPYDPKDFTTQPSDAAEKRAANFKASQPICLASFQNSVTFDPEKVKEFMATTNQPIVAGVMLFKDFPGFEKSAGAKVTEDFVYKLGIEPKGNWLGNHAMAIVGYDNAKKAFLIANSWGPGWGSNGYIWISEDFLKQSTGEAWGFTPTGWKPRPLRPQPIVISKNLVAVPPKVKK